MRDISLPLIEDIKSCDQETSISIFYAQGGFRSWCLDRGARTGVVGRLDQHLRISTL